MKFKIVVLVILMALAAGGFFICQNLFQQGKQRGMFSSGPPQFTLPSGKEKASLARKYPAMIKAINEGPAIYGQGGPGSQGSITDENLLKMKEAGFNTVQVVVTPEQQGGKFQIDAYSKSVLLNDIVKIKKANLAVWAALSYAQGPAPEQKIGAYSKFKAPFLAFIKDVSKEMEEYKIEYLSVHNEPDLVFPRQGWSKAEVKNTLVDFFPSANAAAREEFKGKIINKVTDLDYLAQNQDVLNAALENMDIAAIDVGPPPTQMGLESYKKEFDRYQKFATLAKEKNMPWMVGEYWMTDYFQTPNSYVKENQLSLAQASFDAYLKTMPKGVGYTWNDFSAFALKPNGEATRQLIKNFFSKI